jgi:hypothetical protein
LDHVQDSLKAADHALASKRSANASKLVALLVKLVVMQPQPQPQLQQQPLSDFVSDNFRGLLPSIS